MLVSWPTSNARSQDAAEETITDSQSHRLIRVEPQRFEMGARSGEAFRIDHADYNSDGDDRPIHPVILTRPFYIASSEVTRGQFKEFTRRTGYQTTAQRSQSGIVGWNPIDDEKNQRIRQSFSQEREFTWLNPGFEQSDFHPVVGVSYEDALAYCDWLSKTEDATYRLPTEAEWECASRAGTDSFFSFGDQYVDTIHRHANIANVELEKAFRDRVMVQWLVDEQFGMGDSFVFTAPTASLAPNPWGLYDMHGNVWEWCQDRYLDTFYNRFDRPAHRAIRERAVDPLCDEVWNESGDWRVIRGGSWINSPVQSRSGVRAFFEATDAACYIGFRVVRDADEVSVREATQRSIASRRSLSDMMNLAHSHGESLNGHIDLEFRCEGLSAQRLEPLSVIQDSLNITLMPPGQIDQALVDAVCTAKALNGVVFRTGGKSITGETYARLKNHPELQRVQITGVGSLGNDVIDSIAGAENLVSLHLQGENIDDVGLSQLSRGESLETLRLSDTKSAGHFLNRFTGSPLRTVAFRYLDDRGAELLSDFPSLRVVQLHGCPITDRAIESLVHLDRLVDLDLSECRGLSDEAIASLGKLRFLRSLDLRGCSVGDQTLSSIARLNRLTELRFDLSEVTADALSDVASIASLRQLSISSEKRQISSDHLKDFWRLVNLDELFLYSPSIETGALSTLVELPALRQLFITGEDLDSETMKLLASLPSLKRLSIGDWQYQPSIKLDQSALEEVCESSSLTQVNLVGYRELIGDEEMEMLRQRNDSIKWSIR